MLIRAFEIQIRDRIIPIGAFQGKGMGAAGVKPHIQDVSDLLVI